MQILYTKTFSYLDNFKPSHLGIYFSLLLHLSIVLFAVGLPDLFKTKEIYIPKIIPIEILNVSDITSITPKKNDLEIKKKDTKKIKQKKFNSSENTEIQKIDLQQKPKKNITTNEIISDDATINLKSKTNNINLNEKKINNINKKTIEKIEKVETIKENKIKPKLKPKPKPEQILEPKSDLVLKNKIKTIVNVENKNKKIDKPKPIENKNKKIDKPKLIEKPKPIENKNKKIDKPKLIEKPKPDLTMASIMKDLRNEESDNIINEENKEKDFEDQIEETNTNKNIEISISERDLVLQQLNSCFNPRAGTIIEGDEFLKIRAEIDRQANVKTNTVQIIDTNISQKNPYYVAITESAKAIFYNPLCAKLKLPLNKYEEWKNLTINVDYSWMKN